jgi:hypothetical protein
MPNPYATHLDGRNALDVMQSTVPRYRSVVETKGADWLETPIAPGKWSPKQILCHLADCELAFGFRLRQALAESHHVIQPFDQDLWASPYAAFTGSQALEAFAAFRAWNLALAATFTKEDLARPVIHPERGSMTLLVILETIAGHDLNHLKQLEA